MMPGNLPFGHGAKTSARAADDKRKAAVCE